MCILGYPAPMSTKNITSLFTLVSGRTSLDCSSEDDVFIEEMRILLGEAKNVVPEATTVFLKNSSIGMMLNHPMHGCRG